jgi:outer membrane lipoprotein SlyB
MVGEIQSQIRRTPFVPFAIRTSDGHTYDVPSVDHISVSPRGTRVVVYSDDDTAVMLPILHISGLVHRANGKE